MTGGPVRRKYFVGGLCRETFCLRAVVDELPIYKSFASGFTRFQDGQDEPTPDKIPKILIPLHNDAATSCSIHLSCNMGYEDARTMIREHPVITRYHTLYWV
jgi:hypothetical protein